MKTRYICNVLPYSAEIFNMDLLTCSLKVEEKKISETEYQNLHTASDKEQLSLVFEKFYT